MERRGEWGQRRNAKRAGVRLIRNRESSSLFKAPKNDRAELLRAKWINLLQLIYVFLNWATGFESF